MNNMIDEIAGLVDNIQQDYLNWTSRNGTKELTDINKRMIDEFNSTVAVKEGNKYIKIICGSSVWGFVVNTEKDKLFNKGDILKAAGWAAPARNKARGNILDGGYSIQWTTTSGIRLRGWLLLRQ